MCCQQRANPACFMPSFSRVYQPHQKKKCALLNMIQFWTHSGASRKTGKVGGTRGLSNMGCGAGWEGHEEHLDLLEAESCLADTVECFAAEEKRPWGGFSAGACECMERVCVSEFGDLLELGNGDWSGSPCSSSTTSVKRYACTSTL